MDALTIKLPSELEISVVSHWHTEILQQLANSDAKQNIRIDASQLLRIDTAGIQLLVALVSEASSQNRTLIWQSISVELKRTAERLGLTEIL